MRSDTHAGKRWKDNDMAVTGANLALTRWSRPLGLGAIALVLLAACSGNQTVDGRSAAEREVESLLQDNSPQDDLDQSTLADLFVNIDDPDTTIEVNKYLWNASLDILNFLPLQSADPFSGIIVTGFGRPPGGSRDYRATIFVRDPALEARSLTVALATRNGPAPTETVRAVEDAILTRARQLRVQDLNL